MTWEAELYFKLSSARRSGDKVTLHAPGTYKGITGTLEYVDTEKAVLRLANNTTLTVKLKAITFAKTEPNPRREAEDRLGRLGVKDYAFEENQGETRLHITRRLTKEEWLAVKTVLDHWKYVKSETGKGGYFVYVGDKA